MTARMGAIAIALLMGMGASPSFAGDASSTTSTLEADTAQTTLPETRHKQAGGGGGGGGGQSSDTSSKERSAPASGNRDLAKAGHRLATGIGIPTLVVGLSVGIAPASIMVADGGPPALLGLGNALVWTSYGTSVLGAVMGHLGNRSHDWSGFVPGIILATTGAIMFSGSSTNIVSYFGNSSYVPDALFYPSLPLAGASIGLLIAGEVVLMADAAKAVDGLEGKAERSVKHRPTFAAVPLVAPTEGGATFGIAGIF